VLRLPAAREGLDDEHASDHVDMVGQRRAPGVQHRGDDDAGAEVPIGKDRPFDVAVIGAGSAGLGVSYMLGKAGLARRRIETMPGQPSSFGFRSDAT